MKVGLVAVLVGALMVVGAAVASASSSVCRAPEKCTAITIDDDVDKAVLVSDRDTKGAWSLRCERRGILDSVSYAGRDSVQRGFFSEGARHIIEPELHGAECVFRARGHSPNIAKVRVALTH